MSFDPRSEPPPTAAGASNEPARTALARCGLFSGLDDDGLTTLLAASRRRRYRRAETIFHREDPGDALFVVIDGAVKIEVPSSDGDSAAILTTLGPGETFGELAVLDGAPRSADAVAFEPSTLLVIRREAFLDLVDRDSGLRRALLAALAGEVRRLTDQVADLHFLDLAGRLSQQLLRLTAAVAAAADRSVSIPWPYTQSEVAAMVGGSRQSVNRLLADLERQAIVRLESDELVILDRAALSAVSRR